MNESFLFGLLSTFSSGIATLFGVGLVVVGLVYVRRVSAIAGFCMAGAGALGAFQAVIRRIVGFLFSFGGGTTIYTASQIFTTLISIVAGLLVPVSIFLLANAIKQAPRQNF